MITKVPLILMSAMASARVLTLALRFTGATWRLRTQMVAVAVLATAIFLTVVMLRSGR